MSDQIPVFETYDASLAEIIRNTLDAHGIPAFVDGDLQAGYTGVFPVRVVVPADRADEALEIVHQTDEFPQS